MYSSAFLHSFMRNMQLNIKKKKYQERPEALPLLCHSEGRIESFCPFLVCVGAPAKVSEVTRHAIPLQRRQWACDALALRGVERSKAIRVMTRVSSLNMGTGKILTISLIIGKARIPQLTIDLALDV